MADRKLLTDKAAELDNHLARRHKTAMARIILAEDDDIVASIVTTALMDAGHAVGRLPNGREALKVIESRPPALAILDWDMPEMTGAEVLRSMRINPDLAHVPVLMLTAFDGNEGIAYYDGVQDYMTKPFDPDELVVRVETLLKRRG